MYKCDMSEALNRSDPNFVANPSRRRFLKRAKEAILGAGFVAAGGGAFVGTIAWVNHNEKSYQDMIKNDPKGRQPNGWDESGHVIDGGVIFPGGSFVSFAGVAIGGMLINDAIQDKDSNSNPS